MVYTSNPNEKTLIYWDSKFEIGIPIIDAQHKTLVELCNELYRAISETKETDSLSHERKDAVRKALRKCAAYVQEHFYEEEKLMHLCNYKDFADHKAQHHQFSKKVLEKILDFDNETYTSSLEFVKFLYDWILYHIAYTDTLYVDDLKKYITEKNENPKSEHS